MQTLQNKAAPKISAKVESVLIKVPLGDGYETAGQVADNLRLRLLDAGVKVDTIPLKRKYDLVVAIGGDGTMMRTAQEYSRKGVPTLGVNGGDVGFLTSAEASDWEAVANRIVSGDFQIEERLALAATVGKSRVGLVTNEVLIRHPYSLIHAEVKVGDDVIHEALPADGVLIATATGSTAYNSSVGGPIVSPSSTSVVLNAISPTVLNFRAYVMDEIVQGKQITLKVIDSKHNQPVAVLADGQPVGNGLLPGQSVTIEKSYRPLLFATFGLGQYLEALKSKKGFAR
tara:strand:- start:4323 stop:5180 length:858 start_codon:yes stop_codon:yes gene_type:complete